MKDCWQRMVSVWPRALPKRFTHWAGDRVAGVTRYCQFPPEVKKLPQIGGYLDPNFEAVIDLEPDLVILLTEQENFIPRFEKFGLQTLVVHHKTVEGVVDSLRIVGEHCGVAQRRQTGRADSIADDEIGRKTAGRERPKVLVAIDRTQGVGSLVDVYIAGSDDYFERDDSAASGENAYRGGTVQFPRRFGRRHYPHESRRDHRPGSRSRRRPIQLESRNTGTIGNRSRRGGGEAAAGVCYPTGLCHDPRPAIIKFIEDLARLLHPELDWSSP